MPSSKALAAQPERSDHKTVATLLFAVVLTALYLLLPLGKVHAQTAVESAAQKRVQALLSEANKAGGNLNALSGVVSRHFANGTWVNAVLGKEAKRFSSSELAEFKRLFPDYIAKQYFTQFGGGNSVLGEVTETRNVRGDILVTSRIPGSGRTFTVDWRMRVIGGKPLVIDYSTGGISAVVLRRSEFQSKIKQSGPAGLNDFLKAFIKS